MQGVTLHFVPLGLLLQGSIRMMRDGRGAMGVP